jgi:hypothetical protein
VQASRFGVQLCRLVLTRYLFQEAHGCLERIHLERVFLRNSIFFVPLLREAAACKTYLLLYGDRSGVLLLYIVSRFKSAAVASL